MPSGWWSFGTAGSPATPCAGKRRPDMMLKDAVGMALTTIRTQKLKSFFSLLGVLIGVTFLIAVVSIVQGMNVYMEDQFANKLVGLNTFQLRRMPNFTDASEEQWREWSGGPQSNYCAARFLESATETPASC